MNTVVGVMIPFIGTTLGAAMVYMFQKEIGEKIQSCFLGFASGVMIAASVWSLLIPAIEMSEINSKLPSYFPAAVGFLGGVAFLLVLDHLIPHMHLNSENPEGSKASLGKSTMLMLAVTLHNIPEGMAVGVVLAGVLSGDTGVNITAAFALSIGIALQNIPEGAVISMPLIGQGMSKSKAFMYGTLSGIVEPIASFITIAITSLIVPTLPYILSFAAGAMIYVVVEELIPEAQTEEHSNASTISAALGFTLMMVLDVALG